ncbi:MAG: phosphatidylserine decarboxylase family protein [Bacteroidales bacterium]|nr:phosphatidylserine decarboxylase family protein [Bacteroidales bacterium]
MYLHKEGRKLVLIIFLAIALIAVLMHFTIEKWNVFDYIVIGVLVVAAVLFASFFRIPKRIFTTDDKQIVAPADGRVVVIEEVFENEFLKQQCRQVSIFMSPANVHVNRYPVSGKVVYVNYHKGNYFVASHPKSSVLNEHSSIGMEMADGTRIFLRQIAGAMARRIVCYSKEGDEVEQNQELGFIKFGSRVDLFIPLEAEVNVNLESAVKNGISTIAFLK